MLTLSHSKRLLLHRFHVVSHYVDIVSVYSQRLHEDHVHVIEHFTDICVHDVIDYANSL